MAVTPTGILSYPPSYAKTALSNCATFRTMVGVATPTLSLPFIHIMAKSATSGAMVRPFAIISPPMDYGLPRGGFAHSARMWMMFERDTPALYQGDHSDASLDFLNFMGPILTEFLAYCEGPNDTLILDPDSGIVPFAPPQRSDPVKEEADYWQAAFWINYGTGLS